jgi:2-polyprenyl-3-methyl-5-hydroxy-6-metoxy-1,4-benzoquinol methylase
MNSNEKQLENSWNVNSKAWTDSIRQEKIISRNTVTNPAILYAIKSIKPQNVLDIGCGEGWLARVLAKEQINVVGIDGSVSLIDEANKLGGGTFYHLNYDEFSQSPTSIGTTFDVIVFNFSLLSEEIQSILQACKKVLQTSGSIIIQTLHPIAVINQERYENCWKLEHFNGMGEGYEASMPWYFRTLGSWIKEFKMAGLDIIDCQEPLDPNKGIPLSLLFVLKK